MQKRYEREFMEATRDSFEFQLAASLSMTIEQLRHSISPAEYLQWRAYHVYVKALQDLDAKTPERNGRDTHTRVTGAGASVQAG